MCFDGGPVGTSVEGDRPAGIGRRQHPYGRAARTGQADTLQVGLGKPFRCWEEVGERSFRLRERPAEGANQSPKRGSCPRNRYLLSYDCLKSTRIAGADH